MTRIVLFIFLTIGITLTTSAQETAQQSVDATQTAATQAWLVDHAIPVKSVTAGAGFADLMPLNAVLKDVRIVGLGEATHGSREFFQFKHRMIEFLASEMGYNIFAIEASHAACQLINDYVVNGKGDRAKALAAQGFWTWDTNEVSDMLDWMRAHNERLPESERLRFYGFDIQHNEHGLTFVADYLRKVAPDEVPAAEAAYAPILNLNEQQTLAYSKRSDAEKSQSAARLRDVSAFLESHRDEFVRRTSAAEFGAALDDIRIAAQFDDAYSRPLYDPKNPDTSLNAIRDRYMAENIVRLLDAQGSATKVIVWAHNGHIAAGPHSGMGALLRKQYGPAYYALGFTFYRGTFQSRELTTAELGGGQGIGALKEFTAAPAPEGSVGWVFNNAAIARHIANYIVDFRGAPKQGPVADWFAGQHAMFSAGGVFAQNWTPSYYMGKVMLRDEFDGMVFIQQTTRSRPNPTGMRGPAVIKGENKQ